MDNILDNDAEFLTNQPSQSKKKKIISNVILALLNSQQNSHWHAISSLIVVK